MYSILPSIKICFLFFLSFGLRKEKTGNLDVPIYEIYLFFLNKFSQYKGQKKPYILLMWTVIGGRVGYYSWTEFYYVWFDLD